MTAAEGFIVFNEENNMKRNCEQCERIAELERALEVERTNALLLGEQRRKLIADLAEENRALHILLDKQRNTGR